MAVADIVPLIFKYAITPLFWLILIVGTLIGVWFILYLRRRRRLKFPVIEIVDLGGNGKTGLNNMKGGYFGKRLYLGGLWWTGEEVMRVKTGEIIEEFSTEDFQEVNGQRGVICYRDPLNQNILVPISQLKINNKHLVADIAPASYRDAAVEIVKDAVRETSDWRDKLIQFGSWALVIVFSLISVIVIVQMVKNSQEKAAALVLESGKTCLESARTVCSDILNTVRGNSP